VHRTDLSTGAQTLVASGSGAYTQRLWLRAQNDPQTADPEEYTAPEVVGPDARYSGTDVSGIKGVRVSTDGSVYLLRSVVTFPAANPATLGTLGSGGNNGLLLAGVGDSNYTPGGFGSTNERYGLWTGLAVPLTVAETSSAWEVVTTGQQTARVVLEKDGVELWGADLTGPAPTSSLYNTKTVYTTAASVDESAALTSAALWGGAGLNRLSAKYRLGSGNAGLVRLASDVATATDTGVAYASYTDTYDFSRSGDYYLRSGSSPGAYDSTGALVRSQPAPEVIGAVTTTSLPVFMYEPAHSWWARGTHTDGRSAVVVFKATGDPTVYLAPASVVLDGKTYGVLETLTLFASNAPGVTV